MDAGLRALPDIDGYDILIESTRYGTEESVEDALLSWRLGAGSFRAVAAGLLGVGDVVPQHPNRSHPHLGGGEEGEGDDDDGCSAGRTLLVRDIFSQRLA